MAKIQDPISVVVSAHKGIRGLIRRRADAKHKVDLEPDYVDPLTEVSSMDTNGVVLRVIDSIKGLESHIRIFRIAHESYVHKVKEYATSGRKILRLLLGYAIAYLKGVEGRVYNVLSRQYSFRFKVTVPEFKAKLLRKLQAYDRVKLKTELAIRKFDSIRRQRLQEFWEVKCADAVFLKRTLRQAFEEVGDAVKKSRFIMKRAKMNFECELSTIQLDVDQKLGE